MLADHSSSAIVAVSDIERARQFYSEVLGLQSLPGDMEGVIAYRTGETTLVVYQSDEAGGNRGNAVVWGVGDDVEPIVHELAGRGVTFERYDGIGEWRDGIHFAGPMRLVWLKDPDGNILHLNNM